MDLNCQVCGIDFTDRKGTKYCKPCRIVVKKGQDKQGWRRRYVYADDNYCNFCGIKIPKYKRYCGTCGVSNITCVHCNKQFKVNRLYSNRIFCSRSCRNNFFYSDVDHVKYVELAKELEKVKKNYEFTKSLLTAQQQTTDDLLEQNKQLRHRLKEMDVLDKSSTIMFDSPKKWLNDKLFKIKT